MDKRKILLPFVFIYKTIAFFLLLPFKLINYVALGLFFSFYMIMSSIFSLIAYIIKGFIVIIKFIYESIVLLIRYIIEGIVVFSRLAYEGFILFFVYTFKSISHFLKWTYRGLEEIVILAYRAPLTLLLYFARGFLYSSFLVYRLFYYSVRGIVFVIVFPYVFTKMSLEAAKIKKEKKRILDEQRLKERQAELEKKREERLRKEEELKQRRLEMIAERKRRQELDNYENKDIVIEKKGLGDSINDILLKIFGIPKAMYKSVENKINNSSYVKNARNKREMERENLLSSFQSEEDERSATKQLYQYKGKDEDGQLVTGYFDAYSRVEVHSFLLSEGFEIYSIKSSKWINLLYGTANNNKVKIKVKDLIFFLTQLSTYIKAGIPLVEALKILINQFKSKAYQRVFRSLMYDLTMGDSFSEALSKQKDAFPRILTNMVRAAEMTGQLPEVLDDMAQYFTQIDQTRRQMVTIMTYPAIIFVIAVAVVGFILVYVIPRFVQIYESMDSSQIPAFTLFIIDLSNFLQKNAIWVVVGFIAFIMIFIYLYKEVKIFKTLTQWVIMHIPVFGTIVIYNEVTMFSKTFSSLLAHNVFITDSMDILNRITDNEIYKMIILDTITNLSRGEKISESFKRHWAFPMPAYEMIVTGEKTGELPEMMSKVADYYQQLHSNSIARLKAFIEPILIVFLTVIVGGIVLAIVIPMFNMYSAVQGG